MQLRPFGLSFVLALLALLIAVLVLIGVDLGSLGQVKALALAVILLAVAWFVP